MLRHIFFPKNTLSYRCSFRPLIVSTEVCYAEDGFCITLKNQSACPGSDTAYLYKNRAISKPRWNSKKVQDFQVPLGHALGPALVQGNKWCWEIPAATQLTLEFNHRTVPFKLLWPHHLHHIFLRALSCIPPPPALLAKNYQNGPNAVC